MARHSPSHRACGWSQSSATAGAAAATSRTLRLSLGVAVAIPCADSRLEAQRTKSGDSLNLSFRPLGDSDLSYCYFLADLHCPGWLRVCADGMPLPPQFGARLWRGVFAQFLASVESGDPIGVAAIFDASDRHGTCWIDAWSSASSGATADSVERVMLSRVLTHAFDRVGFRKAYIKYPAWHPPSLDPAWKPEREALLINHLLHDGIHWDVGVMTIDRRRLA